MRWPSDPAHAFDADACGSILRKAGSGATDAHRYTNDISVRVLRNVLKESKDCKNKGVNQLMEPLWDMSISL